MAKDDNNIETIVAEAVKAKVQTMIVDALGEPGELVRQLVASALTTKVRDSKTYRDVTIIEQIVRDTITATAQEAMKEWIAEQRPAIKAELKRRLVADKEDIASTLIDSMVAVAGSRYQMRVTFQTKDDE